MNNTPTIREALLWGRKELDALKSGQSRMDSETLLALALSRDRTFLYAHPEEVVPEEAARTYISWIGLRCDRYPVQYIRGSQEFYGREFMVKPGILIPRPETELLVDTFLSLCRNYPPQSEAVRVLDIGTGSGCIAVTLSAENPELRITAVDIDPLAVNTASANARRLLTSMAGINFLVSDLGSSFSGHTRFDFIVSNPPYVGLNDSGSVDPSVLLHEPGNAVFSGDTGFEFFQRLFSETRCLLKSGGYLILEIGIGQAETLNNLGERHGWNLVSRHQDLAGITRCLVFSRRLAGPRTAAVPGSEI
jgi:release factor glutamine methyltransferase